MARKAPPEWLTELFVAMDVARDLLSKNDWDFSTRILALNVYDDMKHYVDLNPTGKYVQACCELCDRLEPHLPSEFGDDD